MYRLYNNRLFSIEFGLDFILTTGALEHCLHKLSLYSRKQKDNMSVGPGVILTVIIMGMWQFLLSYLSLVVGFYDLLTLTHIQCTLCTINHTNKHLVTVETENSMNLYKQKSKSKPTLSL